jgi:predicted nucleic acid-binding protein
MAGTKPLFYWDTCIWLAWFKNEKRAPGEMEGIQEQVDSFEKGEIVLTTSVVTLTEMLDLKNKLSAAVQRKFQAFFYRRDLIRVGVDIRVAELARDLRDHYFLENQKDGLPTIGLGDAIHLASALHIKADRFITFDGRDSKKPTHPRRGLLNLNGNVAGRPLKIEKALAVNPQANLLLVPPQPVPPRIAPPPSPTKDNMDEQAPPEAS